MIALPTSGNSSEFLFRKFTFFRGRVALAAILRALGIRSGDTVAIQAFTCIAVPEAIMAVGAKPIFIDVVPNGFTMDATDLERKITGDTRAIVVQHTFGIPTDMAKIVQVSQKYSIPVIEDCCHTLVSTYQGQEVGSFGIASFYSFEWGKPIVVGMGGSARINDEALEQEIIRHYSDYKYPDSANQYRLQLQYIAFSIMFRPSLYWPTRSLYHRLSALKIAKGSYNPVGEVAEDFSLRMPLQLQHRLEHKLQYLNKHTSHSTWVVDEYRNRIQSTMITQAKIPGDSYVVFARYPLIVKEKEKCLNAARKAGVELADWYSTPIHPLGTQEWSLVHYQAGSCPNAEIMCQQVVTLPTHITVSQRDINRAVTFFNRLSV